MAQLKPSKIIALFSVLGLIRVISLSLVSWCVKNGCYLFHRVCFVTAKSDTRWWWCSITQSCLTPCDPTDCGTPGFPVLRYLPEFTQTHVHWVMPSNHLILCRPLFSPSVFPSIRVFSSESVLHIRWLKIWSPSFSNSPSNEYSGLTSLGLTGLI